MQQRRQKREREKQALDALVGEFEYEDDDDEQEPYEVRKIALTSGQKIEDVSHSG